MKSTWVVHFIIMKYILWSKRSSLVLYNYSVVLQISDTQGNHNSSCKGRRLLEMWNGITSLLWETSGVLRSFGITVILENILFNINSWSAGVLDLGNFSPKILKTCLVFDAALAPVIRIYLLYSTLQWALRIGFPRPASCQLPRHCTVICYTKVQK